MTPAPPNSIGPSRTGQARLEATQAFGSAAFSAGKRIDLHSFSVKEHAGSGYLSFADIFECNACQASNLDGFPAMIRDPHFRAAFLWIWKIFFLSPSGASQTPSISDASLAYNRFNETKSPVADFATRSKFGEAS